MPNRPKIPPDVVREVLVQSGHRCAVCGVPCPLERAHIEPWHKTKDHSAENLLCLCANCHERADREHWGEDTLKEYKARPWVLRQNGSPAASVPTKRVEIKIQKHLSSFDEYEETLLKHALANFLGVSASSISIIEKKHGSIKILISMPAESADRLVQSYRFHREELQKALAIFPIEEVKESPEGEPQGSEEVDLHAESKVSAEERQQTHAIMSQAAAQAAAVTASPWIAGEMVSSVRLLATRGLTELQKEILKYIQDSQRGRGIAPTHREICEKFGFSSFGTAYKHLKLLQEKGFLRRDWNQRNQQRGIVLIRGIPGGEYSNKELPFFGRIAAGRPIEALSGSDRIVVPGDLLDDSGGDYYALLVVGESMIDDGIQDGDFIIVLKRDSAEPGDMVVALIGDDATLKRFYPEGNMVRLQPANPTMLPVRIPAQYVRIQGVVVGLIRNHDFFPILPLRPE